MAVYLVDYHLRIVLTQLSVNSKELIQMLKTAI